MTPDVVIIRADGASRGNPGPAAIGVTITDHKGRRLATFSRCIGVTTNNRAEYQAVIVGLEEALRLGAKAIRLMTDSELVARQISGRYRVRNPGIAPLHRKVMGLLARFRLWQVSHVDRACNAEEDRLANQALDERVS